MAAVVGVFGQYSRDEVADSPTSPWRRELELLRRSTPPRSTESVGEALQQRVPGKQVTIDLSHSRVCHYHL
jgi:hypothetical protein